VRIDVIAWGIGLFAIGAVIGGSGYAVLTDYRDIASNYYDSLTLTPRFIDLPDKLDPRTFRRLLGIPLLALGLIFVAVGILGLANA
jgi:hypothetical protein